MPPIGGGAGAEFERQRALSRNKHRSAPFRLGRALFPAPAKALVSPASVKPRRATFLARDAASLEFRVRPEQALCLQPCRESRKGQEGAATRSSGFEGCRGNREAELAA
jgi:hypothetical protein